jgi:hypothetical protein
LDRFFLCLTTIDPRRLSRPVSGNESASFDPQPGGARTDQYSQAVAVAIVAGWRLTATISSTVGGPAG